MAICYIMIGLPGSGKSTWIKDNLKGIPVISSDAIIEEIAKKNGTSYDFEFKDNISFANKEFERNIKEAVDNNLTFIVDRTNLSMKVRKRLIDSLPLSYQVKAVFFHTPSKKEHARRLKKRPGKTIPKEVLESMILNFEEPLLDEGFDEIWEIRQNG